MIVTIFRSRLREGITEDYTPVAREMLELAQEMPGFVSFKTFRAEDGERVSIVEFADWDSHLAWARQPRHREAQQMGRDSFYSEFHIQVGEVARESHFPD